MKICYCWKLQTIIAKSIIINSCRGSKISLKIWSNDHKIPSQNAFRTLSNIYGAFSIELLVKTVTSFIICIYNGPKKGSSYVCKSDWHYKWMEYCNKVVYKNAWQEILDKHCNYRFVNCLDSFACVKGRGEPLNWLIGIIDNIKIVAQTVYL